VVSAFLTAQRCAGSGVAVTNHSVFFDPVFDDEERRRRLFEGQLIVYSARKSSQALCEFARKMAEEAFAPHDPRQAQHHMTVDQFAETLGRMKPGFIHHPRSKQLIQEMLGEFGCDLEKTYFDVPKMRSSTADGYLTTGIAYAWHPHRDTWYSAPPCQINWWLPLYEITADNAMAFHPRYFSQAVANTSAGYNYYRWNQQHRGQHVARFTAHDPRPLPRASEPLELNPQIRLVVPPGAVIMFAAGQLHSSVPNTSGLTRFSVDFRLVNVEDAEARRGAPNVDSQCTGTTMRDYLRGTDLTHVPDHIVQLYDDRGVHDGALQYQPGTTI
jgi:hypothetical protein